MTTPETLTRSEAHRRLLALGMPANVVTHVLDHPDELLHLFSPMPTVVPSKEAAAIVAAYQREIASEAAAYRARQSARVKHRNNIFDRAVHWLTPVQSLGCGADPNKEDNFGPAIEQADCSACLSAFAQNDYPTTPSLAPSHPSYVATDPRAPAEQSEIIASAPGQIGPGQTPLGAALADIHAARGVPEFQPGYHHPDPTIDAEVRADLAEGRAIDASAGVREGWHRGWIPTTDATPETPSATSTIADAFAKMLSFLAALLTGTMDHAQITALRDLVQRAADEHEQIRAAARERLDRVAKARRERKAADLAAGRVTEEELADIAERTAGPGPLAGDGELLRRCRAEIVSLRGERDALQRSEGACVREALETVGALKAEIERWTAPIDVDADVERRAREFNARWKLRGFSFHEEVRPFVEREARLRREIERLTAKLAGIEGAVDASRPGLTEEQAREMAGPLCRDIYNRIGLATGNRIGAPEWMRDSIAAALLRASRGAPAPGHVAISRAVLSRLVDATQRDPDVREARETAEHVLHLDALRYEPARHDAKAARAAAKRGAK